jgi:nicotinamidase-related amidase
MEKKSGPGFGADDLKLPDDLRAPLRAHLDTLRERYRQRSWAGRVGFGKRPALLVIDLAAFWVRPDAQMGSHVDPIVESTAKLLGVARKAKVPIFFTTFAYDPAHPPSPHDGKLKMVLPPDPTKLFELDPRLGRLPTEPIIRKRYASAFKGTNFDVMLTALGIDTLIVTGLSTSHCVYATCRDATDSFRVIVPREAVGERCELMHEVFLLDIDIDLADVMPLGDVVRHLESAS